MVFYAECAREILVTQASPLACLLFDARALTLFATGALRLLRNPWRAELETLHTALYADDRDGPTNYVADGDAFHEILSSSRISECLLVQARLQTSAEFAQSLAPQRKLLFMKFADGGSYGDLLLTTTAMVHATGRRLGLDGMASNLDFIRWDHLEDMAGKEVAMLVSGPYVSRGCDYEAKPWAKTPTTAFVPKWDYTMSSSSSSSTSSSSPPSSPPSP